MSEALLDGAWLRRLFFGLVLLYAIPPWTVHYLPTVDGPCHTYNAWIIRSYSDVPLFQKYYEINTKPYPNWTGHGLMALLMFVVPPLVAEKLLVTLYVLVFLSGAWYLSGAITPDNRWLAFLAFPFVYNYMFQFGFYNFSLGLGLFLWTVGYWWRRRDRVNLRYGIGINLLLWLCYFSHIVAFVVALMAIAVLWLVTFTKGSWRHVPVLLPQVVLPAWYFAVKGTESVLPAKKPLLVLARYLLDLKVLVIGEGQQWFALVVALTFLMFTIGTLWWVNLRRSGEDGDPSPRFRRPEDAFLVLAVAFMALYFLSPDGMGGGSLLKPRLSMLPYLILLPWLAPPLTRRARGLCVAGFALMAVLNLGYVALVYQVMTGTVEKYLAGLAPVRPNTRVLPLLFHRDSPALGHAIGYAALEKNLIDWDNFEATGSHFPAIFRASAPPPPYEDIEYHPGDLPVEKWKDRADYIYAWRMPQGHPLVRRLAEHYNLISVVEGGALWERRP